MKTEQFPKQFSVHTWVGVSDMNTNLILPATKEHLTWQLIQKNEQTMEATHSKEDRGLHEQA